jgi:hypothetical protein
MTESEWWACQEPQKMLQFLQESRKASDRKLRLFAVACVRPLLLRIEHDPGMEAVKASERYADGLVTEE